MNFSALFTSLGITVPAEQEQLQQQLQNAAFERFVYKVASVGKVEHIQLIRDFLTSHRHKDRQALWQLMHQPYYAELLADAWAEQLSILTEGAS